MPPWMTIVLSVAVALVFVVVLLRWAQRGMAAARANLGGVRTEFTEGVMSQSTMEQLHRRSKSADPDDNGQIDRSVYISVRYNSCGVGGNVTD